MTEKRQRAHLQSDVVGLAVLDELAAGHERMQIALIHRGAVLWLRLEQLLNVSLGVVAYADALDPALVFGLLDGLPALEAALFAAVRAVYQVQIDVAETAFFQRLGNTALGRCVAVVRLKLGAVEDVGACDWAVGRREVA